MDAAGRRKRAEVPPDVVGCKFWLRMIAPASRVGRNRFRRLICSAIFCLPELLTLSRSYEL